MDFTHSKIAPGQVIKDQYLVDQYMTQGTMCQVFLAQNQKDNNKNVILKILNPEYTLDKEYLENFRKDVIAINKVAHPNVVKVLDFIEQDGLVILVIEHVPGDTLRDLLKQNGPFPVDQIPLVAVQICDALEAIHRSNVVHRDLKPSNVFLHDEIVKISDFGIARMSKTRLSQRNIKVGSFEYIAPEIWTNSQPSFASDFYTLGILLYELLTGKPPFFSKYPLELMQMHTIQEPKPPEEVVEGVEDWLSDLILTLLEKHPEDRFESCDEIIEFILEHDINSHSVQRFSSLMAKDTVKEGDTMMTVFPSLARKPTKKD